MRVNVPRRAVLFEQFQHPDELRENQNLLAVGHQRVEQFKQRVGLAAGGVAADERRVAANLAQARERSEHVHLALVDALRLDHFHHLVAAAAQLGQIQFALLVAERAIQAVLDAVGQILCDVLLQPAQQQRAQFGRQPFARDALDGFGFLAARGLFHRRGFIGDWRARFVGFDKLVLIAEVAGLDEIHDESKM